MANFQVGDVVVLSNRGRYTSANWIGAKGVWKGICQANTSLSNVELLEPVVDTFGSTLYGKGYLARLTTEDLDHVYSEPVNELYVAVAKARKAGLEVTVTVVEKVVTKKEIIL